VVDIFESRMGIWLAMAGCLLLLAVTVGGAVAKQDWRFWALAGFVFLLMLGIGNHARQPAVAVVRLEVEGFRIFRQWTRINNRPWREVRESGHFLMWKDFVAVTAEERTAHTTGRASERVLRLKVRRGASIDRTWSHAEEDGADFLVVCSGLQMKEERLTGFFRRGIEKGSLPHAELRSE
jgi:hypothetical protein